MTRRIAWFATGIGVGVWATRRLGASRGAESVAQVGSTIGRRVRRAVDDVVADTRADMRRREARLRDVFAAPDRDAAGAMQPKR